ncbi:MAG: DUF1592 domain-containing protein [Bdellovibrionota bacterium]
MRFLSKVSLGTEIAALCHVMRGVCLILAGLCLVGCYPQMLDVRSNSTGDSKNTSAEEEASQFGIFRGFSCQPGVAQEASSSFIKRTQEEVVNRLETLLSQIHLNSNVHLAMWNQLRDVRQIKNRLPNERAGQYDRMTGSNDYSFEFIQGKLFIVSDIVSVLSEGANWNAWRSSFAGSCSTQANLTQACRDAFLTKLFSKSFPEGFSEQLFSRTSAAMTESLQADSANPKRDWLKIALIAALLDPRSAYRLEAGQDQAEDSWRPLSDSELASRLTSVFWMSVPDEQIQSWINSNQIRANYEQVLEYIFSHSNFYKTMGRFADQWMKLEDTKLIDFEASSSMIDRVQRLGADQMNLANYSEEAKQEARTFFVELLKQDVSFSELFLSDASYATGGLAQMQGLPSWSEGAQPARYGEGKVGLFTMSALHLNNGVEKSHILAGYSIFKNFLCMKTPSPESAGISIQDFVIPHAQGLSSSRERTENLVSPALCQSCHSQFDQYGFGFSHVDPWGVLRSTELVYDSTTHTYLGQVPVDLRVEFSIGGGDPKPISQARELAESLVDSKFPQACFARQFYRFSFGREEALSGEEACALQAFYSKLIDESQSLKDALKEFAKSRFFTERYTGGAM